MFKVRVPAGFAGDDGVVAGVLSGAEVEGVDGLAVGGGVDGVGVADDEQPARTAPANSTGTATAVS